MKTLTPERKKQIVSCLVEGNSIRSTCRITGTSKGAVLALIEEMGEACADLHNEKVRNLTTRRVQCDEIWSFVGMKQKTAKKQGHRGFGIGDVWTWTAIDADSKLMVSWLLSTRDAGAAFEFMTDVASRLSGRVQLTTDGHSAYLSAVPGVFGLDVDYAMLVKTYGEDPNSEHRYSPPVVLSCESKKIIGFPEPKHISTSYVERSNLTIRMAMRRFTRLTNGFSKSVINHGHAIALHMVHYNFCRVHQSLRVTPAMEAGITDHVWEIDELVALLPEKHGYR